MTTAWSNWGRTVTAHPARVASPSSVDELRAAVARAAADGLRVKAVGAGHSFTGIAATDGAQIGLDGLSGIVDTSASRVTVLAGTRLGALNDALWQRDLAMTNLGDIDVQTISGAISTGTHGTGAGFGGLGTQVRALQIVQSDGTLLSCSATENPEIFQAARIGLGALGVIATVTLECEPAYVLHAAEAPEPLDAVLGELDENVKKNDHFEFYWFPHTSRTLTKRNNRLPAGASIEPLNRVRGWIDDELLSNRVFELLNRLGTRAPSVIPCVNKVAARALGSRTYADRSYRVFTSPRRVVFREMEYAVPRESVPAVLADIDAWIRRTNTRVSFPVEVRFAAADDIWLSTANGRASGYVAVHEYWRREFEPYFRAVEAIAMSVGGRPHWGKLHWRDADSLRTTYPAFDDFTAVRDRLDPDRVFGNQYLARVLGS